MSDEEKRLQYLSDVLDAQLSGDGDAAIAPFHDYLTLTTQKILNPVDDIDDIDDEVDVNVSGIDIDLDDDLPDDDDGIDVSGINIDDHLDTSTDEDED